MPSQTKKEYNNIDGEKLSDLRFADDVAQTTEDAKDLKHQLNTVKKENLKIGLKIHKRKTKFMTNIDTDKIQIDGIEIEKVTNYNYLGQTIAMENRPKQEVLIRMKVGWSASGKYRDIFLDRHLLMCLKRKVIDH